MYVRPYNAVINKLNANATNRLTSSFFELETNPYLGNTNIIRNSTDPNIRREGSPRLERINQESDIGYPLYGTNFTGSRLKPRKNFMKPTTSRSQIPEATRIDLWKR